MGQPSDLCFVARAGVPGSTWEPGPAFRHGGAIDLDSGEIDGGGLEERPPRKSLRTEGRAIARSQNAAAHRWTPFSVRSKSFGARDNLPMSTGNVRASSARRRQHWEAIYEHRSPTEVSWYQRVPAVSMELIEEIGVPHDSAVLDVGGGTSTLVDTLVARSYTDITVLDVSAAALDTSRRRVDPRAQVKWVSADLLTWQPGARYALWHDRAVFHFLVTPADRERYLQVLRAAVLPGAAVILGTFAADGPESCSGLPVARYAPDKLAGILGGSFRVIASRRERHTTPTGAVQPFTWLSARREPEG